MAEFTRQAWPIIEPATELQWNWHIDCISEYLEAVTFGEIRRLVVNIPPRHMKSISASIMWPVWSWIKKPSLRWIFTGHKEALCIKHSLARRLIIASNWYQKNWSAKFQMSPSQDSKTNFLNNEQGMMMTTSVGASIVGEGGDIISIDDPIDPKKSLSDDIRKAANEYCKYLITRLNSKKTGAIVLIMQRVHENDPAAVFKELGYECISLECIAKNNKTISFPRSGRKIERKKDDLIWEEREGPKEVEDVKKTLGSYKFAAQYQQDPSPAEGGIFKRRHWRYYKVAPTFEYLLQSWDCSFKGIEQTKKDDPDYVVGQVWGVVGADRYLLDQYREMASFTETISAIKSMRGKFPGSIAYLVEDKANGPAVINTLSGEIPGLIAVTPEGGKLSRAYAIQPTQEAGNIYIPDPSIAPWVHDYIEEHSGFPKSANDDQVDATSQANNYITNRITGFEIASGGSREASNITKGY